MVPNLDDDRETTDDGSTTEGFTAGTVSDVSARETELIRGDGNEALAERGEFEIT